jgi:uncharacterized protein YcfJ
MRTKRSHAVAVLLLSAALATPLSADARPQYTSHQCAVARHHGLLGGVIGAVGGGLIGHSVAAYALQVQGAWVGAVVLGAAGYLIGRNTTHCEQARS